MGAWYTPPGDMNMNLFKTAVRAALLGCTSVSAIAGVVEWTEPRTGMEFVRVPAGCYLMGTPAFPESVFARLEPEERPGRDEMPRHEVCVGAFWIGRYEVTRAQWQALLWDDPSEFRADDDQPVQMVSWADAQAYLDRLNEDEGANGYFRLPTEAEWEYACRSGGREEHYAGGDDAELAGWIFGIVPRRMPMSVGTKAPNGLGIYDMTGNVGEWVADGYFHDAYERHDLQDPEIETDGDRRVLRGGSYRSSETGARCAARNWDFDFDRLPTTGLRVVRDVRAGGEQ